MPLYEYECKSCDQTVEALVRSAEEPVACPECGATGIQRVFSVPAAPSVKSNKASALPMASEGPGCGAPRCCGGGCDM